MSLIKILPENLANQIAAGEVVERPSSVVKELLENSIDAGAKNIAVQIENGGTGLIRIIDDGCGMDEDDILLSLERHATSKLNDLAQLNSITTLGFRGEAIPSIASVSKMTITARGADAPLGNRVEVHFGKIIKVHEMGAAPGTVIEVKNLFGNVPARRKFLKSTTTEIAHIDEAIRAYALANYQLGFALQVNGRRIFDWDCDGSESARIVKVMGGVAGKFTPIKSDSSLGTVHGYLPVPDPNATKSAKLWLFVNGRSVKDRVISHAASEGMRGFLMKGRRAAGVIFLDIHAQQVDVNVHPAKQEVRFRQANLIHKMVEDAVRQAMLDLQGQRKIELFGSSEETNVNDHSRTAKKVNDLELPVSTPVSKPDAPYCPASQDEYGKLEMAEPLAEPATSSHSPEQVAEPVIPSNASLPNPVIKSKKPVESLFTVPESTDTLPAGINYIGQFMETYLLFEVETGIAVIDQHAAQERLLFERLKKLYESREMSRQLLMFPEMIDLTSAEMEILEQNGNELARLGMEIEHFGGSSFVIKAVPSLMKNLPPADIFRELLARFYEENSSGESHRDSIQNILASMACKAAIKAGMGICRQEAEKLLCQIRQADIFSHCPHGRPVVKLFSPQEIKKWFSRT